MIGFDFMPIDCKRCGKTIWNGLSSSGFETKLDITRLNLQEEIIKLILGVRTYQIHRTAISFEATRRTVNRMGAKDPIVLAEHSCSSEGFIFGQEVPDYWGRTKAVQKNDEGIPF